MLKRNMNQIKTIKILRNHQKSRFYIYNFEAGIFFIFQNHHVNHEVLKSPPLPQ